MALERQGKSKSSGGSGEADCAGFCEMMFETECAPHSGGGDAPSVDTESLEGKTNYGDCCEARELGSTRVVAKKIICR